MGVVLRRRLEDLDVRARDLSVAVGHTRERIAYGHEMLNQLVEARTYKRDREGKFSSGAGGSGVRDSFVGAQTIGELNGAAASELKRITGRDIGVDMTGSDLGVAKEHLEGIAQGFERFPNAIGRGERRFAGRIRRSRIRVPGWTIEP